MATRRTPVWIPYLLHLEIKGKKLLRAHYNGGLLELPLSSIESLMLYCPKCDIKLEYLSEFGRKKIPIVIHQTHIPTPTYIVSGPSQDANDVLSSQLIFRADNRRRRYIARMLLHAKFIDQRWLIPQLQIPPLSRLSIQQLRTVEAVTAKRYWEKYFDRLGFRGENRRGEHEISQALDALSRFASGIILRWTTYHHLSPFHGFLHEPTDYPSLIYDFLEPYRSNIDRVVFDEVKTAGIERLTERSTVVFKRIMDEQVYCPLTRQVVSRKVFWHGIALALRSYLLGDMNRFCVPIPGEKNGGRPVKVSWQLPGRAAGPTKVVICDDGRVPLQVNRKMKQ